MSFDLKFPIVGLRAFTLSEDKTTIDVTFATAGDSEVKLSFPVAVFEQTATGFNNVQSSLLAQSANDKGKMDVNLPVTWEVGRAPGRDRAHARHGQSPVIGDDEWPIR
jgi:hypothetical protein